jgi:D-lactate dehydrogenase
MRQGTDHDIRTLKGFNLFGKTLGVVGTGRIGRKVVAIAKGFGMQVIASDTKPDEVFANEQQFRYIPLETLASTADIITLHAPYLQATHHLFDTAMFARMKKGVVLINTARGELVDTRALVAALQNGTVWGAGLDVLEKDEEALNRTLIDMPNTVVTPHVAFETVEALEEIERATAQAITNFVAGTEQQYL